MTATTWFALGLLALFAITVVLVVYLEGEHWQTELFSWGTVGLWLALAGMFGVAVYLLLGGGP